MSATKEDSDDDAIASRCSHGGEEPMAIADRSHEPQGYFVGFAVRSLDSAAKLRWLIAAKMPDLDHKILVKKMQITEGQ